MLVNKLFIAVQRMLPLLLLLLVIIGSGVWIGLHWSSLLLQSTIWQKMLHQQMAALLQQVVTAPGQAGLMLMFFSLLYGILHAAGPGHGKVVIATFLATHPTRIGTSLRLTFAAALVQGVVAIAMVTLMLGVLHFSSRQLHISSYWLEKSSYVLVIALGIWLCWRAARTLVHTLNASGSVKFNRFSPVDHQHHAGCGCRHQHLPDNAALAASLKTKIAVVMSMGLRPCSGAIMMLLFSKVIGVYRWGVLSALVMALGTALTVSLMAMLVQVSRALAIKVSRRNIMALGWQKVGVSCLSLLGGALLIIAGTLLWFSATPALSGGIRPMF